MLVEKSQNEGPDNADNEKDDQPFGENEEKEENNEKPDQETASGASCLPGAGGSGIPVNMNPFIGAGVDMAVFTVSTHTF